MRLFVLTFWLTAYRVAAQDTVEVVLKQGAIEGERTELEAGRSFLSFKSIPFARPPVGELRFKDPEPAEPWTGVRNGSIPTPSCPQLSLLPPFDLEGEEDCLYLSVYTPKLDVADLPVMVWIHGGGFAKGNGDFYAPLPLLNKDIVLVVVQYRLGTLGFLSTGDTSLPGNLGLKDQTLALQWVKDNIRDLGGDPDKVTIFGESAGAASVHFHVLSPMSTGLFNRAIMQSGTSLNPWALREDHREVAFKVGEIVNCTAEQLVNTSELAECLRGASVKDLISAMNNFIEFSMFPFVMVPSIDGDFLPDHPAILLREGRYNKVDIISGVTQNEGLAYILNFVADNTTLPSLLGNFSKYGPLAMDYKPEDGDMEYLARRTFHHYLGPMEDIEAKREQAVQLFTDRAFHINHQQAIEFHKRDAVFGPKTFAYVLHHSGELKLASLFFGAVPEWAENYVDHGDDLPYFFSQEALNRTLKRPDDIFVSQILVDLWTNFAATGNPTPDLGLGFAWSPADESPDSYLAVTSAPAMRTLDNEETRMFWLNMPTKVNKLLYPERFARNEL